MSAAVISPCGQYRYTLERDLPNRAGNLGAVLFVMLNPSKADASVNDPTIRRCMDFASRWGYGRLLVGNLFAYRATDPRELLLVEDPFGEDIGEHLDSLIARADLVVCAWGGKVPPAHSVWAPERVLEIIRGHGKTPNYLKLNADGSPAHPLYLRSTLTPQPFPKDPTHVD